MKRLLSAWVAFWGLALVVVLLSLAVGEDPWRDGLDIFCAGCSKYPVNGSKR